MMNKQELIIHGVAYMATNFAARQIDRDWETHPLSQ